jgi:hypothetical protein
MHPFKNKTKQKKIIVLDVESRDFGLQQPRFPANRQQREKCRMSPEQCYRN